MSFKKRAFTLIELLVVIVVIGILASIGVATFSEMKEKARLVKAMAFANHVEKSFFAEKVIGQDEDTLMAFYNFDEPGAISASSPYILDSSGEGNNLTSRTVGAGGASSQSDDTPISVGKSLRSNNTIHFSHGISGTTGNKMTVSLWVKLNNHLGGGFFPFLVSGCNFYIGSNGVVQFSISGGNVQSSAGTIEEGGTWNHFVGSYNGDTEVMRLWMDGELIRERENVTLTGSFAGGGAFLPHSNFDGLIDNALVISKAFNGEDFE